MVLSQRLKNQAKRLGVRLMVKRGNKRVYKSPAVLRKQIKNKEKKKTKRKSKFGVWWNPFTWFGSEETPRQIQTQRQTTKTNTKTNMEK